MAEYVILTAPLYDRRDPNRPAVFIAPKNAKVPREMAEKFGGVFVEEKKRTPAENKKRTPSSTKKV